MKKENIDRMRRFAKSKNELFLVAMCEMKEDVLSTYKKLGYMLPPHHKILIEQEFDKHSFKLQKEFL